MSANMLGEFNRDGIADLRVFGYLAFENSFPRIARAPNAARSALSSKLIPVGKELKARPFSNSKDAWLCEMHIVIRQGCRRDVGAVFTPSGPEQALRELFGLELIRYLSAIEQHMFELGNDVFVVPTIHLFSEGDVHGGVPFRCGSKLLLDRSSGRSWIFGCLEGILVKLLRMKFFCNRIVDEVVQQICKVRKLSGFSDGEETARDSILWIVPRFKVGAFL